MDTLRRTWYDLSLLIIVRLYNRGGKLLSLYRVFKAFYRMITGTTELYRICLGHVKQVSRPSDEIELQQPNATKNLLIRPPHNVVFAIDRSILNSDQLFFERRALEDPECNFDDIVSIIARKKRFSNHSATLYVLRASLLQLHQSFMLINAINTRAACKYDSSNPANEKQLLSLWDRYMPDEKLSSRISDQWTRIGFQGKDPAQDFRGMGMLGLDDLAYFVNTYPAQARRLLHNAQGPSKSWYSFAIVSIQISAFCVQVLRMHALQYLFYTYGLDNKIYHEFYCLVFIRFDEYWQYLARNPPDSPLGRPVNIMDFERVFKLFKRPIYRELATEKITLPNLVQRKKAD